MFLYYQTMSLQSAKLSQKKQHTEKTTGPKEELQPEDKTHPEDTDDIQMIMSQCNIEMQEAVELYAQYKCNVVNVIAHFLKPNFVNKYENNKTQSTLQQKYNNIRNIANIKDAAFRHYLDSQKASTSDPSFEKNDQHTSEQ